MVRQYQSHSSDGLFRGTVEKEAMQRMTIKLISFETVGMLFRPFEFSLKTINLISDGKGNIDKLGGFCRIGTEIGIVTREEIRIAQAVRMCFGLRVRG